MLLYLHPWELLRNPHACITEILSYFFILQNLTTSKMRTFLTLKLTKQKLFDEIFWLTFLVNFSGERFEWFSGEFFCWTFLVNFYGELLWWTFWVNFFYLVLKLNRNFKLELSPSKPLLHSTQSTILRVGHNYFWLCT